MVIKKLKPTIPQVRFDEPVPNFREPIFIKKNNGIVTSGTTKIAFKYPVQFQFVLMSVMINDNNQMTIKINENPFFQVSEMNGIFFRCNRRMENNKPGEKSKPINSEDQAITMIVLVC